MGYLNSSFESLSERNPQMPNKGIALPFGFVRRVMEEHADSLETIRNIDPSVFENNTSEIFDRMVNAKYAMQDAERMQLDSNRTDGTAIDPKTTSAYLLAKAMYEAADKELWAIHGLDGPNPNLGTGLLEEY